MLKKCLVGILILVLSLSMTLGGDLFAQQKKYKGTIVVSILGADTQTTGPKEAYTALIEAYKKVQPDVQIIIEAPTGPEYPRWAATQLANPNPRPDLISGNYVKAYDKYVDFNRYRYTINPYTGHKWDEDLDFTFFSAINPKGQRYMLPTQAVHILWFYNKNIFKKVGIRAPKDWDEFAVICGKIKSAGYIPLAFGGAYQHYKFPQWLHEIYWDQYNRDIINIVRAQPGDWNYDPEIDGKWKYNPNDPYNDQEGVAVNINWLRFWKAFYEGKISYDTPGFRECFINFRKIIPKYNPPDFFTLTDDYPLFLQQKAAITIDGTWMFPILNLDMKNLEATKQRLLEQAKKQGKTLQLETLQPFEWGTFENPPMRGRYIKGPVRSIESATGEYVSIIDKNPQQTEMVLDFVMFWLSPAGYQAYIDGYIKSGRFTPGGPIMVRGIKLPKEYEAMFKDIKMLGNAETPLNQVIPSTTFGLPEGGEADRKAYDTLVSFLQGKIDAKQFSAQIQKIYKDNLPTAMKASGITLENILHPERPGQ